MPMRALPGRRSGFAAGAILLAAALAPAVALAQQPDDPFAEPSSSAPAAPAAKPAPVVAPAAAAAKPTAAQPNCCTDGIREAPPAPALNSVSGDQPQPDAQTPAPPAQTEAEPPADQPGAAPPAPAPATIATPSAPPPAAAPPAPAAPPATVAAPAAPPAPVAPPAPPPATVAAPAAPPAEAPATVVAVDHPTLIDTATLQDASQRLPLFGITGLPGAYADSLKGYISSSGDRLSCQPHEQGEFTCTLPDGTDIAMAALINGAAQARNDAPETYVAQQNEAQAARRGVWASLPPPPVPVAHPTVPDTATLVAESTPYPLDGIQGVSGGYANDLRGYIAANGDSAMCQPQGEAGHFVCLLPDGTDIAKAALVNGAARVAPDAPDEYRLQQADAITNRRGIWAGLTEAQAVVLLAPPPDYVPVQEEPYDGMMWVGGDPAMVVDGGTVFLAFVGGLGWGYWGSGHVWHGAPAGIAGHLDRYHAGGAGLRGYGPHGALTQTASARTGMPGGGGAHTEGLHGGAGGFAGGGGNHFVAPNHFAGPNHFAQPNHFAEPGHAGAPGTFAGRPSAMPGAAGAHSAALVRPAAPTQFHQGAPNGGFTHQGAPGFRQGAPAGNFGHAAAPAFHPGAPAFHAAAPAFHAAPAARAPAPKMGCKSKC